MKKMKSKKPKKDSQLLNTFLPPPNLPIEPNYSEGIIKIIIDKLISMTITRARNNKHSNLMPSYCSSFNESTLKTFITASFIYSDYENESDLKGYVFTEPSKSIIERDSGSLIHIDKTEVIKSMNQNNSNSNNNNINEQNSITETLEANKFNRTASRVSSQHFTNTTGLNINLALMKSPSQGILAQLGQRGSTSTSMISLKKKKTAINIDPSFDLLIPSLTKQIDIADLNRLRQEMAIEQKEKELQLAMVSKKKMALSKSAANIINDNTNIIQKGPLFEMKTSTFDSNGVLIPLRYIPIDSFKKDFSIPRTEVKEESIPIRSNTIKISSLPNIQVPDDTMIITNNISNLPSTTNRKYHSRKDDPSKRAGIRYECSGDNYEKIIPSPGVTIISQDELKVKKGDMNYHRDFNKLSMNDYKYLAQERLPNISSLSLLPLTPNNQSDSIVIGGGVSGGSIAEFSNTNCINSDSNANNSFKAGIMFHRKPSSLTKYDKLHLRDMRDSNSSLNMIMSKGEMSLSNVFIDNSEQTTGIEEHSLLENKLRHNIINFVPKKREKMIPFLSYEQIDRFNKIILQDNNWGRHNMDDNRFNRSNSNNKNRKVVIGRRKNTLIKRDTMLNGIQDYKTRKLFFRK